MDKEANQTVIDCQTVSASTQCKRHARPWAHGRQHAVSGVPRCTRCV